MKEMATEAMVTVCANARPSFHPRKPASAAPTSGANAAMQDRVIKSMLFFLLSLQAAEIVHIDRLQVPEQRHQDRETDRRLGRGDREDEEHEHLSGQVVQRVR